MLMLATLVIMLIVGYAQFRNGISSSIGLLISVLLSGLLAFNFWEPLADLVEPYTQGTMVSGCEDLILLVLIFSVALALFRLAINTYLAPDLIDQHGMLQFFGAAGVGLITGYLVAGFLLCAVQTLPLDDHFLDFETRAPQEAPLRSFLPPDRVWLSLMRHAATYPLNSKEENPDADTMHDRFATFDRHGTFELRYQRYRRNSMPYFGEFDRELYGKQKPR